MGYWGAVLCHLFNCNCILVSQGIWLKQAPQVAEQVRSTAAPLVLVVLKPSGILISVSGSQVLSPAPTSPFLFGAIPVRSGREKDLAVTNVTLHRKDISTNSSPLPLQQANRQQGCLVSITPNPCCSSGSLLGGCNWCFSHVLDGKVLGGKNLLQIFLRWQLITLFSI